MAVTALAEDDDRAAVVLCRSMTRTGRNAFAISSITKRAVASRGDVLAPGRRGLHLIDRCTEHRIRVEQIRFQR